MRHDRRFPARFAFRLSEADQASLLALAARRGVKRGTLARGLLSPALHQAVAAVAGKDAAGTPPRTLRQRQALRQVAATRGARGPG